MNLGILLNMIHMDPAALLNMTLPRSRGILMNLNHLDPAALLNMILTRSRGSGEPWDTAEHDSLGSSGTTEHDSS